MRRALLLTAVAAALVLLWSSDTASAATIPGTPIQVLELDPPTKEVWQGAQTNFSWVVSNPTGPRYRISLTANASDPDFSLEAFPANFTLGRDEFRVVRLNVTAPRDGAARTARIHIRFSTISPVASAFPLNATVVAQRPPGTINALTAFVAIGAIIAIGFAATLIFERTKIPDLLILIFLGVLLGPVALTYFGVVFVPRGVLEAAAPYFAAVALMMILFDGGLNLPLLQVIRKIGAIGLQTGMAFLATMVAVAYVSAIVLGYDLLVGFLLGAILGGTSSAVVIGVVRALQVGEDTKVVLTLESVLTDVLCVVSVIAIIELIRGGPGTSVGIVFIKLAQAFFVALGIGLAFGIGWLFLLRRASKKPFAYMLTIAMLFVLYGVTETAGGSGAMASFVFGLILGNHEELRKRLRLKGQFVVDERIKQFHAELSFVIRTFFFVFLGIVFTFQFGGGWDVSTGLPILSLANGTFALFLAGIIAIFLAITGVRIVTARVTAAVLHQPPGERRVVWSLMGRGLAAAVLASLPFTIPAFTAPATPNDLAYQTFMAPYEVQFLNIVFFIIILTVVVTTLGAATYSRLPAPTVPSAGAASGPSNLGFMSQLDFDEWSTMKSGMDREPVGSETEAATDDDYQVEDAEDNADDG
ncbi:MAG TPA: cation:proton antiporter [Thermoplasmata archaeon]|jgi:cell volume regulation protein A|nr:cation:proton antiporter [Thermoplasmata archaeon]